MKAVVILCSFAFLFPVVVPFGLKPKTTSFDSLKVGGKQKELYLMFVKYIFDPSLLPLYEKTLYSKIAINAPRQGTRQKNCLGQARKYAVQMLSLW